MKNFLIDFFTWKGRLNRMKFWVFPLIMFGLYLFISFGLGLNLIYSSDVNFQELGVKQIQLQTLLDAENNNINNENTVDYSKEIENLRHEIYLTQEKYTTDLLESNTMKYIGMFMLLFYAVLLYLLFTLHIRRLHDLNKSGWLSLLMFLPIINLYLFVICGFFKGTDGPNQYGPDPLKTADENKDMPEKGEDTVIQL